jgi:hypothetical protein
MYMNTLDTVEEQLQAVSGFFQQQQAVRERLEYEGEQESRDAANDEKQDWEALAA